MCMSKILLSVVSLTSLTYMTWSFWHEELLKAEHNAKQKYKYEEMERVRHMADYSQDYYRTEKDIRREHEAFARYTYDD